MKSILTEDEYKKLVMGIAIQISPTLVKKKPDSIIAGESIAIYAKDIADSVEVILKDRFLP